MHVDHNVRGEKKDALRQLVRQLGAEATPAQIREEAYRVGIGQVNGHMLASVRKQVWPRRVPAKKGFSLEQRVSITKSCPSCRSVRVYVKYTEKTEDGMVSRTLQCRDCDERFKALDPVDGRATGGPKRIDWATITEKPCTKCKQVLPLEAFGPVEIGSIRKRPACKKCLAESRSTFHTNHLLKRYGITIERYHELFCQQDGRCAICGTSNPYGPLESETRKRKLRFFAVDHCHETGKVRGLLCARCNLAIGNFNDDIALIKMAIDYIQQHRPEESGDFSGATDLAI
jgi:hypothetical protein